jgi:hypothetical protein
LKGIGVFIPGKRDDRKPLADAANEKHGLLAANAVLARHPGQCRVHFSEAVRSAAAC